MKKTSMFGGQVLLPIHSPFPECEGMEMHQPVHLGHEGIDTQGIIDQIDSTPSI